MEVTSYGQMENIYRFGHYTVGGKRDIAMDSIHDVIHLSLTSQPKKELLKTNYSLDELRDLESKIVLITGSKAENRAAVDQFLDVRCYMCMFIRKNIFSFLSDPSFCYQDSRSVDKAPTSRECEIHWMENGLLLQGTPSGAITTACHRDGG